MEQERHTDHGNQGHRRNLDHLKRGDQNAAETANDQAGGSEESGSSDQNRLIEWRSANALGEDIDVARRLNLDNQGDELMGEVTYDRASDASRSSLGIDRQ
jgi:hypothetical protein